MTASRAMRAGGGVGEDEKADVVVSKRWVPNKQIPMRTAKYLKGTNKLQEILDGLRGILPPTLTGIMERQGNFMPNRSSKYCSSM